VDALGVCSTQRCPLGREACAQRGVVREARPHFPAWRLARAGRAAGRAGKHGEQLLLQVAPREHARALALLIGRGHRLAQRVLLARHRGHLRVRLGLECPGTCAIACMALIRGRVWLGYG